MKLFQLGFFSAAYGELQVGINSLPSWAIQCPIRYPYSVFGEGTDTVVNVTECCKCQSQTKCQQAHDANYFNYAGSLAMEEPNGVVDKSELRNLISKFLF